MKTFRHCRRKRGLSLPLMLVVMVLMAGISVSLLVMATNQRKLSRSSALRQECRLYRNAIQMLLQRQLIDATNSGLVWTSQPGMLRTFDANGKSVHAYKLYSDDEMQFATGNGVDYAALEAEDAPTDWQQWPAQYVDLNEERDDGYPIVDPDARGEVEGFTFDAARGVEMPVQWLYVLENGQVTAGQRLPGQGGGLRLPGAGKDNPVVARIAFWGDDETCRVNVNTACGGTYWDVPLSSDTANVNLAWRQPVAHEYGRFPGHPARVDLGKVFPELLQSPGANHDALLQLAPRYGIGGSSHGTKNTFGRGNFQVAAAQAPLYSRFDDWAMSVQNQFGDAITAKKLNERRFFVTSHAPSSELNLYGQPRISLWPMPAQASNQVMLESKLDLVSTLPASDNVACYFQRSDPRSLVADAQLPGNSDVLNYLRQMTEVDVPGFPGGSLRNKFGERDREHVLAGIFDFVRSVQTTRRAGMGPGFTDARDGRGQVVPSEWTLGADRIRGGGRMPSISEVALHFYPAANSPASQTTEMSAVMLFEMTLPGQGYPDIHPQFSVHVQSPNPPKAAGADLDFSGPCRVPTVPGDLGYNPRSRPDSGLLAWNVLLHLKGARHSDPKKIYPYIIENIPVTGGNFAFVGGDYVISLRVPDGSGNDVEVQRYEVHFPSAAAWPVPQIPEPNRVLDFRRRYRQKRDAPPFFGTDTVRSVEYTGDPRILASSHTIAAANFKPGDEVAYGSTQAHVSSLYNSSARPYEGARTGKLVNQANYGTGHKPNLPASMQNAVMSNGAPGDWESGQGNLLDGGWARKPDEGFNGKFVPGSNPPSPPPYFASSPQFASTLHLFSHRELTSAVQLGAIPRGHQAHWETLLFCPNPAAGSLHPGAQDPPDYLWLDLFRRPVVEPFAIGDAVSSQGKVNLNAQMAPFASIKRTTALHSVLASTELSAVPLTSAGRYKLPNNQESYRHEIDIPATMEVIERRFHNDDVYRSETEICGIPLVPEGVPVANLFAWWQTQGGLSGDNARERPYGHLLPLLTTRSHAYRVYYKIERLQQPSHLPPDVWTEDGGRVLARVSGQMRLLRVLDRERLSGESFKLGDGSLEPYFSVVVQELGETQ